MASPTQGIGQTATQSTGGMIGQPSYGVDGFHGGACGYNDLHGLKLHGFWAKANFKNGEEWNWEAGPSRVILWR